MKSAYLLIDARGPEIQHRCGLTAPDQFIYLAPEGKKPVVLFDAREFGVQQEKLDRMNNRVGIRRLEPYVKKAVSVGGGALSDVLMVILQDYGIKEVKISRSLPYSIAKKIIAAKIKVAVHDYERERERKTELEIQHMIAAQRANESAFQLAWLVLAKSKIRGKTIIYKEQVLTSEYLKSILRKHLLDRGYDCPDGIIVASGEQTRQPHNEGSGPLLPNTTIIIDIFPRSEATGYFADMTRTFVKGRASKKIKELLEAVAFTQKQVIEKIALGDQGRDVHKLAVNTFRKLSHPASPQKGFMHGTGHSLGLALHEAPRLNAQSAREIEAGMVLTIEPGLYYPGIGGVRIEDVVVFHPDGRKENITRFNRPYFIS